MNRRRQAAAPSPRRPVVGIAGAGARLAAHLAQIALVLLVIGVPLLAWPAAIESFRLPKLVAAEVLGLASLVLLALCPGRLSLAALRRQPALALALPLLVVAALGLATSEHQAHVRAGLVDLAIGLACLVGWSAALPRERTERLLGLLAIPAVGLVVLAVLQLTKVFQPFAFAEAHMGERLTITSLAGNPGDLGAFLVLPALLAQWRAFAAARPGGGRVVWGWSAVAAVAAAGVVASQTLAALAALAGASALLWLLLLPTRRALGAVGALAVVGVVAMLAVAPLRERIARKAGQLASGDLNSVLTGRLDGWRVALWMFERRPLAGVGLDAYSAEFVPGKLALVAGGVGFYERHVRAAFDNAHNDLLQVAAELGVPGLITVLWGLVVLVAAARRLRRADRARGALAWAALLGLAVLASAHFPLRVAVTSYPILLLLAWLLAGDGTPTPSAAATAPTDGSTLSSRGWRAGVPVALLALPLAWATLAAGERGRDLVWVGTKLREVQERSLYAIQRGEAPRALFGTNFKQLSRASKLDPSNPAVPMNQGTQYLLIGSHEGAARFYRAALAVEPRPEIYLNLGRALLALGRTEEANEALDTAVTLAPVLAQQRQALLAAAPGS